MMSLFIAMFFLEVNYETFFAIHYYCRLMTVNDLIALIVFHSIYKFFPRKELD